LKRRKRTVRPRVKIAHAETESKRFEDKLLGLHEHARQLASAANMNEMVAHTLNAMEGTLGFSLAGFSMVEDRKLRVKGKRGRSTSVTELSLDGPGITVKAVNQKRPLRLSDTRLEPAYVDSEGRSGQSALHGTLSELAVPILVDEEAVGALNVESTSLNAFTETDEKLLETLALHVASALKRLKNEGSLRESEERYRLMFENTADAVAVYEAINGGADFVLKEFNTAAEKIEGIKRKEVIGRSVLKAFPGVKDFGLFDVLQRVWKSGKPERHPTSMYKDERIAGWRENYVYKLPSGEIVAIYDDVTERKRMEEEIRSLAKFPSENPNPVLRLDKRGTVRAANKASEALLQSWGSAIGQVAPKYWRDLVTDALSTGQSRNIDVELNERSYTFLAKPIMELGYVNLYGRDITERNRAEETLRQSERKYRELVESAQEGIWTIDKDAYTTFVNPRMTEMLGYTRDEMIGKHLFSFMDERGVEEAKRNLERRRQGISEQHEFEFLRKDGTRIYTSIATNPITDERGNYSGALALVADITERKRMEQEISRSRQFLESIVDNANVWLDVLDEKANVLTWNKAAEAISGYSREEVVGHGKIWEWLYPDEHYRREVVATATAIIEQGQTEENFQTEIRCKDGKSRIIAWNSRNLLDEDSRPMGSIAIGRDVTDQVRMQKELERYSKHLEELVEERTKELRASEEKYRSLVQNIPEAIWTSDREGNTIFVSSTIERVYGYTAKEILEGGKSLWAPRIHSDDLDRVDKAYEALFERNKPFDVQYRFRKKDGTWVWLHDRAASTYVKDGVRYAEGIISDITENRRIEEDLQASMERLDFLVTANPAVIFSGKPHSDLTDFDMTYLSRNLTSMLGYEPQDFINDPKFWQTRVHPEDRQRVLDSLPRLFREGHIGNDYRFLHKDGTYPWVREQVRVIPDATGNPMQVVGYWTDVTEQKRMEEALLKSERLAAIGETASMVAHDLRNPLQGIIGATYNLRNASLTINERDEMLELIEDGVEYSDAIVRDLLDYSSTIQLALTESSPRQITSSALRAVRVPNNIRLQDLAQVQPTIRVDPDRMKRVFVNLIENAVDAMPGGGTLTISSRESNGYVEVVFTDTGTGIPKDIMATLWKPLHTTKAKGVGLGLAICKRLVEAHGGEISVETKIGEGTTFTLRLPIERKVVSKA